ELECIQPVNAFGVPVPVQNSVEVVPVCYNPGILEVSDQASELSIAGFREFAESVFGDIVDSGGFSVIKYRKYERVQCDEMIMNVDSCCEKSHMGIVCELFYKVQAMFIEVMLEFRRFGEWRHSGAVEAEFLEASKYVDNEVDYGFGDLETL
ncbi:9223_t:CDS:2, partial [Gigaspora rosea]